MERRTRREKERGGEERIKWKRKGKGREGERKDAGNFTWRNERVNRFAEIFVSV